MHAPAFVTSPRIDSILISKPIVTYVIPPLPVSVSISPSLAVRIGKEKSVACIIRVHVWNTRLAWCKVRVQKHLWKKNRVVICGSTHTVPYVSEFHGHSTLPIAAIRLTDLLGFVQSVLQMDVSSEFVKTLQKFHQTSSGVHFCCLES